MKKKMQKEVYINKNCKIHIIKNDKDLFYTATIVDVSDTHISFQDRDKLLFTYRWGEVDEISEIGEVHKDE